MEIADNQQKVLSADRLTFGYQPGSPVIDQVSLEVSSGQLCAVIGPNAAGKSTLLQLMLGQLQPWSGTASVSGSCVTSMTNRELAARVSYVPQRSHVGFAFTVQEVVAIGRYAIGEDAAAVDRALQTCELYELRHRVYSDLSIGQQQRVLLARAIAQSVGTGVAMLLDEPVNAMDLWHVHRTMQTLADLAKQGLAVIVVVHDINLAARYADTVAVLENAKLIAHGSWDQVVVPDVLESVYRVNVQNVKTGVQGRPVFVTEPR